MSFKDLLQRPLPITAPLVLNPLMAKMVESFGFDAGYLAGGSFGYEKVVLEANVNLTELCQLGLDIRTASSLPLILDGACGFGDPMHLHRTIAMAEAAGFAAIELEDQILPKRAHHHIGIEHMIPAELMAAKIKEAVAARRNPDFVIIGRTNAMRASDMDDALRRAELYRKAGADVLLLISRRPEELRTIAQRLGGPLMHIAGRGGLAGAGISLEELGQLGYKIVVDVTALVAGYAAWRSVYQDLSVGFGGGIKTPPKWGPAEEEMLKIIGIDRMLEIERATVEKAEKT